jgi:hypothetical protein
MTTLSPSGRSLFVIGAAPARAADFEVRTGLPLVAVATEDALLTVYGPPYSAGTARPRGERSTRDIISAEPLRQYGMVWTICQLPRPPHRKRT